jgi:hypothetical protein
MFSIVCFLPLRIKEIEQNGFFSMKLKIFSIVIKFRIEFGPIQDKGLFTSYPK